MSELIIPSYLGLIISYIYSLLISFFLLKYFQNMEKTNKFIFCVSVLHLSFFFLMPVVFQVSITSEENRAISYNKGLFQKIILISNITNQVINKFIYPIIIIYMKSGYLSKKYKLFKITIMQFKDYAIPYIGLVIILILYIPLRDTLNDIYGNISNIF